MTSNKIDYSDLPEHMQQGMKLYIENNIEPGGFLFHMLSMNIKEAFARADVINRQNMDNYINWIHDNCPRDAWGSEQKVLNWLERRQNDHK